MIKDSTGQVLTNLEDHRDYYVAARGGAGGKGNYHFLSNENRAPAYAEEGAKGEERKLLVELKTMAHAGLVRYYTSLVVNQNSSSNFHTILRQSQQIFLFIEVSCSIKTMMS